MYSMISYFSKKQPTVSIIVLLTTFSFGFLFIRVSITKTLYFAFLVWNLFLAAIPYAITLYLSHQKTLSKARLIVLFFIWLAFLPNAPYIITDLFHLKRSALSNLWIDTLVISTFAITGLLLFYFSIFRMKKVLLQFFNTKRVKVIIITTIFLSAFGVYIGRFLRYNSWELLSNPLQLFSTIVEIIFHPINNQDVWVFTVAFGIFLHLGYAVLQLLKNGN